MKIPTEFHAHTVDHAHGGNGWAVVAVNKGEWMDVVQPTKITPGTQIFHVWNKKIKASDMPITDTQLEAVNALRAKLASGEYIVSNTRLVKATP